MSIFASYQIIFLGKKSMLNKLVGDLFRKAALAFFNICLVTAGGC
jgi:hypothetical protein